ncbi:TetR/AcrR family transcriptional regulator [Pseudomonas sichuanensis]|uniref:TetR/AcrR family transcriptional regulator n=1 Tax=Pseudomonas sichuanensis TaxID=2213015 RepID=UPI002160795D|nr:TetR/AcrR family transcriptional regulator [Pseudomonas sichuanensis]UVK83110.1 TetR/AcrR family transcriptional regulator [Pseudomonas sichuanensis]
MKVTKDQAQANRAHIVETSSKLFRERGYDGVGVADLMSAAGFTHGGFYKHFKSKADLMGETATCGINKTIEQMQGIELADFVNFYLSRKHRDEKGQGCTLAALGGDAARQTDGIKATYEAGIEGLLEVLQGKDQELRTSRAEIINTFAHALGALVLSRACPDDSPLADEVLRVCREQILEKLAP